MQKIISLFCRNYDGDRLVRNEVVPGAEWVLDGEGIPSRKWDGIACMVRAYTLYKRYDAKAGRKPPPGWESCQESDPVTGHWPGWLPVGIGPEDKWYRTAYLKLPSPLPDGTYELCGPHVQGNPEGLAEDQFIRHGADVLEGVPRTFEGIRDWLASHNVEGIVWHHSDGRMVKIKAKDFGLKRSG